MVLVIVGIACDFLSLWRLDLYKVSTESMDDIWRLISVLMQRCCRDSCGICCVWHLIYDTLLFEGASDRNLH